MRELDPDVARAIEGVVFDVDDTLTRDGIVEREAYDALWSMREAGLVAIAVTGRPLAWAETIAALWPIAIAVGENGAGWHWRSGRRVLGGLFERDPSERARQRAALEALLAAIRVRVPHAQPAQDQHLRRCDLAIDVGETRLVGPANVQAIVEVIEQAGMRSVVSSVHAHAIPGGWDKASGTVRAMREALGIGEKRARARYLFVGDSGNDAPAFAFFEHTAAVANVRPHLGALVRTPRWVAREDRGRGFAEIVATLIARRG